MSTKAILRNLRVKRVSLVDMGANFDRDTKDGAHITLYKSASVSDVHVPVPPVPKKDEPKTEEPVNDKEIPVSKSIIARLLGLVTEQDVNKRAEAVEQIAKEFPTGDDKPMHKADDPTCKCADCMNKSVTKAAGDTSDLAKKFTDLEKRNDELQKSLQAEITKREVGEVTSILKSFKATPFDMEKDVETYHQMRKANPAMFESIIAKMRATDEMLAQSALFKSVGSGRSGGGDAWSQIEAKADAMVEKSTKPLTREQALEKVMMDPANRGLVKQYRAEQQ